MVPTLVLDEMVRVAGVYGSKITLVGDYAQMGAPEAGGLLRDLAATPGSRRAHRGPPLRATLGGRRVAATACPPTRDRRHLLARTDASTNPAPTRSSTTPPLAWWNDTQDGKFALIVVDTASDAADVNTRCQLHLMVAGRLGEHVADASDGSRIHIGDTIQTRRNTSEFLASDHQRILNRDVWTVTGVDDDGSLQVRHATRPARGRPARRLRRRATSCSPTPPRSPARRVAPSNADTSSSPHAPPRRRCTSA